MVLSESSVLIVVDVQNGFTTGGNLAVTNAEQIIPSINRLAQHFDNIVLTQDWHPENHISFAENLMCAEKTGGFNLVNYRHSSGVYHEQETEDLHRRI